MSRPQSSSRRSPLRRISWLSNEGGEPLLRKDDGQIPQSPIRVRPREINRKSRTSVNGSQELEHDLTHLAPPVRRFWQKARSKNPLSPRSSRLINLLPPPKDEEGKVLARLSYVQRQMTATMNEVERVQGIMANFLKRHFEMIPAEQFSSAIQKIFKSFDLNGDGRLNKFEIRQAFASLGKAVSDEDLKTIMDMFDTNHDSTFDPSEFENMVRTLMNRWGPPPASAAEEDDPAAVAAVASAAASDADSAATTPPCGTSDHDPSPYPTFSIIPPPPSTAVSSARRWESLSPPRAGAAERLGTRGGRRAAADPSEPEPPRPPPTASRAASFGRRAAPVASNGGAWNPYGRVAAGRFAVPGLSSGAGAPPSTAGGAPNVLSLPRMGSIRGGGGVAAAAPPRTASLGLRRVTST